nr:hypothetical protein [uncultured Dongia sp.]
MDWIEKISGCFSRADHAFAGNPMDDKRAKALRADLMKAGVSWDEVEKEFQEYQEGEGAPADQIATEMRKVEKFFRLKLSKSSR